MNIGDKILEFRKSKGYSQEDIANKLNVSRQTISKWETNQSTPDFDKIVPLCQLFDITTDELLMNSKVSNKKIKLSNNEENLSYEQQEDIKKRKFAFSLSISIFLYFLSVMWVIFSEFIKVDENIMILIFLGIVGIATVIIVYSSMVNKSRKEELEKEKVNPIVKKINNILALVFLVVYLFVSFITNAWYITWILWVVYSLVVEIVKVLYELER